MRSVAHQKIMTTAPTKTTLQEIMPHHRTTNESHNRIDWSEVVSRCQSHPEEASQKCYPNTDREYHALHIAVRLDPPLFAVKAMLEAFPQAIDVQTREGSVLQIACKFEASHEVVRLLLCNHLQEIQRQGLKQNPIHFVSDPDIDAITAGDLLQMYPQGAMQADDDYMCPSPLAAMIVHYSFDEEDSSVSCDVKKSLRNTTHGKLVCSSLDDEESAAAEQRWDKLMLLLQAADNGFIKTVMASRYSFQPLHILLRCIAQDSNNDLCHCGRNGIGPILRDMKERRPDEFLQKDRDGHLPLHALIKNKFDECMCFEEAEDVISQLLEMAPQSACIPFRNGRLPLHVALENGWPSLEIFKAAPQAISTRDASTHMYPLQIAASSCNKEGANRRESARGVETIYSLLLQNPTELLGPSLQERGDGKACVVDRMEDCALCKNKSGRSQEQRVRKKPRLV